MTEQEIKQKIEASEHQIVAAYNNLRSAAQSVGLRGEQAADIARQNAISEASRNKLKNTFLPLLISVVGFFMLDVSVFLGLVMLIGGIVLAYILYRMADKELWQTRSKYNKMVNEAWEQKKKLNAILDNNTKI